MAGIDDFIPPDRPPSVASNSSMVLRSQCRFTRSGLPCPVKTNNYARGRRSNRRSTANSFQSNSGSMNPLNGSLTHQGGEFSDDDFGHGHGHSHNHSHGHESHGDHHHDHLHDFDNESMITPSISDSDMERLRDIEDMDEEEEVSRNINHVHHIVNHVRRRGYTNKPSPLTQITSKPAVQPNHSNFLIRHKRILLIWSLPIILFILVCCNYCTLLSLFKSILMPSSSSSLHIKHIDPSSGELTASQQLLFQSLESENQEFRAQLGSLKGKLTSQEERLATLGHVYETLLSEYAERLKQPCCNDKSIDHTAVQRLIDNSLAKYDADKTGLPDFALESSGGTVVNIRCSETFRPTTSEYRLMGIPVWRTSNSPRVVIHPSVSPGECWAFHGSEGHIVIKLARKIVPTSFSYEHAARSILPDGAIEASPKDFRVYGLANETDTNGHLLGHYTYDISGLPLQTFLKQNPERELYEFIELKILNNHGNPDYTCLYRFRVHGIVSH